MFSSGNVTVYVSNMDRAVRFYTEVLGLKLAYRFGDHWASVEVGRGLTIGLHPASAENPAGRKGSIIPRNGQRQQGRQVRGVPGSRWQSALSGRAQLEPRGPG